MWYISRVRSFRKSQRAALMILLVFLIALNPGFAKSALAQGGAPDSTIKLQMPFIAGETWTVGGTTPGSGYFYGEGDHTNVVNDYYATDWNRTNDDGAPVLPVADGIISTVDTACLGSYGCYVEIDHANGYRTRYAHLSAIIVGSGTRVHTWDLIGNVGSTGHSEGSHLHLSFRHLDSGAYYSRCWNNGQICPNNENPQQPQGYRPSPMMTTLGPTTLVDGGTYTSVNGRVYLPDLRNNYTTNGWTSELYLRNDGYESRTVTIYYFNANGTPTPSVSNSCALPPGQRCWLPLGALGSIPSGTIGSAFVDGGEAISVVVNNLASTQAASYNGVLASSEDPPFKVGKKIYTPLSLSCWSSCGASAWHTIITVRNVSASTATFSIIYYPPSGTGTYTRGPFTLVPGALNTYDASDSSTQLGFPFAGSAVVDSNQDIAVVVSETNGAMTGTYNGVTAGATTVQVPLIVRFGDWTTGLQLQNLDAVSASGTITYYNSNGFVGGTQPFTIPANGNLGLAPIVNGWTGVAVVTGNTNLAVEADEFNSVSGDLQSFNGVKWASAIAALPDVRNTSTWYTGMNVQNVGGLLSHVLLTVNGTLQWDNYIEPYGWRNFGTAYIPASGQAKVQSLNPPAQPLLVEVDNYWNITGDMLMSYIGVNR